MKNKGSFENGLIVWLTVSLQPFIAINAMRSLNNLSSVREDSGACFVTRLLKCKFCVVTTALHKTFEFLVFVF